MAQRKKPSRVKTVKLEDYTPLEIHAIQIREYYLALCKAGFRSDAALTLCTDKMGWPEWFVPNMPEHDPINPDHTPYEDEEDD